ncbi:MAG: hypothetical protein JKY48_12360 [Flavobacteriales bacterium]|nr:hypothetical protein [Flavobacteriales bacterium]
MIKTIFIFMITCLVSVNVNAQSQALRAFLKYWDEAYDVGKVVSKQYPKHISVSSKFDDFLVIYPSYNRSSYSEINRYFKESYAEILKRKKSTHLKVEIAPYVKKKNVEIYNKNLAKKTNPKEAEKLLKEFYDIQFGNVGSVKEIQYHPNRYKSYGRNFGTRGMQRSFEIKMQYVLKKFGFYEGKIDGLFGRNSKSALKKLEKFLGVTSGSKISFTTEGATVILNANKTVNTVEKILTKNHTAFNTSTTICVSRKGDLSLTIGLNGLSLTLVSDRVIIVSASKNGKSYSTSTKKEEEDENIEEDNTKCKLGKICIGTSGISADGSCNGVGVSLSNLNSLSISGGDKYVDIPLN